MPILVEICVDTPQSLLAAVEGGGDRVELCSALALGGLTPSRGIIDMAARLDMPVFALIRPREGDFDYSPAEVELMKSDIRCCVDSGLAGVVIGATSEGALDIPVMSALIDAARPLAVTLHRAFDILDDPLMAIEDAAALGCERILTSGGALDAEAGIEQIKAYVDYAEGRISIMAGGGITAGNAVRIIQSTGIGEIHGTFSRNTKGHDITLQRLGFASNAGLKSTSPGLIRTIKRQIDRR